jgi:hypothetical protein
MISILRHMYFPTRDTTCFTNSSTKKSVKLVLSTVHACEQDPNHIAVQIWCVRTTLPVLSRPPTEGAQHSEKSVQLFSRRFFEDDVTTLGELESIDLIEQLVLLMMRGVSFCRLCKSLL